MKVKKVPVILQMETLECGAASLGMILAYYKKYVPLEQLRIDCSVSRDGSSAKYIVLAARRHGLKAKGVKMSPEALKKDTEYPMIIHWEFNHFVVLCGFKGDTAVINDPAGGTVMIPYEEFDRSFTGIVLKFEPGENFEPSGRPKSMTSFLKTRLGSNAAVLLPVTVTGAAAALAALVRPVFYKLFTDGVLIDGIGEWMSYILIGMAAVLAVGFAAEYLRARYLEKFRAKLCMTSSSGFMWHILRLPVEFYSQRFTGDVASRQQSNNEIARLLCDRIAPVALDVVMIGIYLAVMLYYSTPLTLIAGACAALDLVLMRVVSKKNMNAARTAQRDSGKLSGMTFSAVSMIETIKAGGAEQGIFEKIAGYQTKYNLSKLETVRRGSVADMIPEMLLDASSGAVLILGVYCIFNGDMTIGTLMAFQSFMEMFLAPVGSVTASMQEFRDMSGDMERVEDVMSYPVDVETEEFISEDHGDASKLTGEVEMIDLSFAYSPAAPPIIDGINIHVKSGGTVALVGGSGSGKSTIAKLVAGLYEPRSGAVMFDGKERRDIDRYVFKGSVAAVDQTISLFEGSVRDNITMWDDTISEATVIEACRDACIHDDIMTLEGGYDHMIAEGGGNFSGGQRQRLEIARAFAAEPSIMILDEATSALDPSTEKLIMDAVRRRHMTCFIIAHRLSTIRDADEIIMLERGTEVERGTHDELMALDGHYAKLVRSE